MRAMQRRNAQRGPMPSPVETAVAMTEASEEPTPADVPDGSRASGRGTDGSDRTAAVGSALGIDAATQRGMSPSVVISVFGGLLTTLLGALIGLMMWQFSSLGSRVDAQGIRIENLGSELRAEMSSLRAEMHAEIGGLRTELRAEMSTLETGLRAEMQAGFREINAILLGPHRSTRPT